MLEVLSPLQRFWRLLALNSKEIYQIYGYAVLNGFVNLSLPLGIQSIISFIQTGQITFSWGLLVSFVLVGIIITGILQILQLRIVENIQHELFARSAFEFAYRIPKLNLSKVDAMHLPEVVNRFFDTITIQKGIPKILIDLSLAIFQIVFGMILLSFYSPYFMLLGILIVFFVWVIILLNGKKAMKYSLEESKTKYALAYWLEDIASSNKSFKFYSEKNFHLLKADKLVANYLEARENHFQILLRQFKQFVGLKFILAAGLLIAGSLLVINAQLNIGQFVAAEIVIIIIISSIEKIINVLDTVYDVLTGLEKIGSVTDIELDENDGNYYPLVTEGIDVRVKDLRFQFVDAKIPTLDIKEMHFPSKSLTVFTGDSGNGKTTLLKILGGILQSNEGELLLNNVPLSNYSQEFLHENVGYLFSKNELFEGTIWENLTLGYQCSEERVFEILSALKISDFVAMQPKGLHSSIDSAGRRIPKSVIQKLLLVRALIHQPKLLLLDQPLSSVELGEREEIINWLTDNKHDWTIITSSNDSFWKNKADQIIKL